jgi:hypothetical protein
MRIIDVTKRLALAAALAGVACARVSSGPAPTGADPVAASPSTVASPQAASASAQVAKTLAPAQAAKTPVEAPPLEGGNPTSPPAPVIESPAPPLAPAAMQAMTTTQATLDGLATGVAGTRVRFVDCSASAACAARLEAQSLAGMRDLLQSVSQQQGGVGFVVREQLDGFTGRTFVADVTLGAASARAVPTNENELLAN